MSDGSVPSLEFHQNLVGFMSQLIIIHISQFLQFVFNILVFGHFERILFLLRLTAKIVHHGLRLQRCVFLLLAFLDFFFDGFYLIQTFLDSGF